MDYLRIEPVFPERISAALRAVKNARSAVQALADLHKYRLLRIVDLRAVPEEALEEFGRVASQEADCLREVGLEIVPPHDFSHPDVRVADLKRLGRLFAELRPGSFLALEARSSAVNAALYQVDGHLHKAYNPVTRRSFDAQRVREEMAAIGTAVRALRDAGVGEEVLHFIARYVAFWSVGKSEEFRQAASRRWTLDQLRKERDPEVFAIAAENAEEAWAQDVLMCERACALPHVVEPLRKHLKRIRDLRLRRQDDAREAG